MLAPEETSTTHFSVVDADGTCRGFRGVIHDITDRKREEENLKNSLSLLAATLESTADGILVADGKGKMMRFNRRFTEMWGLPADIAASGDDDAALGYGVDFIVCTFERRQDERATF